LAPDDPARTGMPIAPRTLLCATAYRVHAEDSLTRFEELRELSTLAGDKAAPPGVPAAPGVPQQ
jgi:hypothetical protein